jgi:hypothetical protein
MNTINGIENNYKKFDDWKILELAENPSGLREDVIPILLNELRLRKLDCDFEWIKLELKRFDAFEKEVLTERIEKLKCSQCLMKSNLNGYEFNTRISVFITDFDKTEKFIICKKCARKKRIISLLKTSLFGWWSRAGIISTPFTILFDISKVYNRKSQSKKIINEFIENNTGNLRKCKTEDKLFEIIEAFNQIQSR